MNEQPTPTPEFLRSRAQWYRDGCDGLEDLEGYKRDGLTEDAANDLDAALDIVARLQRQVEDLANDRVIVEAEVAHLRQQLADVEGLLDEDTP